MLGVQSEAQVTERRFRLRVACYMAAVSLCNARGFVLGSSKRGESPLQLEAVVIWNRRAGLSA